MTEEELRKEFEDNPEENIFNNFHGHFPGGYKRAWSVDLISDYLYGDKRQSSEDTNKAYKHLKLWVTIDTKLLELGLDLLVVNRWVRHGELESNHREVMIQIFVYLVNLGYDRVRLIG